LRREASNQHDPVDAPSTTPKDLHDGVSTVHDITTDSFEGDFSLATESGVASGFGTELATHSDDHLEHVQDNPSMLDFDTDLLDSTTVSDVQRDATTPADEVDTSTQMDQDFQNDEPMYYYGTEMVEIVHLQKEADDSLDKMPEYKLSSDSDQLNASSTPATLTTTNSSVTHAVATNRMHEVPHNPKRVLVNVTITTDDDGNVSEAHHRQVYVLSVAVPTNDNTNESLKEVDISPPEQKVASVFLGVGTDHPPVVSTEATRTPSPIIPENNTLWGGKCVCSCPTVKPQVSLPVSDGFEADVTDSTLLTDDGSSESNGTDTSFEEDLDEDSEVWLNATEVTDLGMSTTPVPLQCPEVPVPEILILEGEVPHRYH